MDAPLAIPPGAEEIALWAYPDGPRLLLYPDSRPGCDCLRFAFRPITAGIWDAMEAAATRPDTANGRFLDYRLLREEYLRRCLVAWNLDFPLAFDSAGNLAPAAWQAALRLRPEIVRAITNRVFAFQQSDEELKEIERQAHALFARHQSVPSAHPMVALYCHLEMMWEKFGLNWHDLQAMPLRERNALRQIAGMENSIRAQERQNDEMRRNNAPRRR